MLRLSSLQLVCSKEELGLLPEGKVLVNSINAHSFNMAQKDRAFAEALAMGDYLIPDGQSIVKACKWLKGYSQPKERIAGWDLFSFEMNRLNQEKEKKGVVMFLGSSESVLKKIRERVAVDYPNLETVTYSPPFKSAFSAGESRAMVESINRINPDLLWIGMTAPKQEKWTYQHWDELDISCHVGTIGAVFDFYAGTVKRAPLWMQRHALEWLYRLVCQPGKMWRRYVIGNPQFIWNIIKEKINL